MQVNTFDPKPYLNFGNITNNIPESYFIHIAGRLDNAGFPDEAATLRQIMIKKSVTKLEVKALLSSLEKMIANDNAELERLKTADGGGMEKILTDNDLRTTRIIYNVIKRLRMENPPRAE